ncbi:MAG: ABC transporter permease [Opitutales bacterium]|jgi:ABC-2 type transport system permease protein
MRNLFVILRQEVFCLFISPATFIAGFYFLLVLGLLFWFHLGNYPNSDNILPPISEAAMGLFMVTPTLVPFLTMRSLAEERRAGTLETLLATPTPTSAIIIGKWGAAYLYYLSLCGLALGFPAVTVYFFEVEQLHLLEPAYLIGSTLYLSVSGAAFVAIGIFASSLTKSQLVAGMLTFSLLLGQFALMIYFFVNPPPEPTTIIGETIIQSLGPLFRGLQDLRDFARGTIDSRAVIYHLSTATLFLGLATLVTQSKEGE